jgi:hypothetical protein
MLTRTLAPLGFVLALLGSPGEGIEGLGIPGPLASGPGHPQHLSLSEPLLKKLTTLAAGLHREVILCLEGSSRGAQVVADDFLMPLPLWSTSNGTAAERCPEASVALWHNHPVAPDMPGGEMPDGVRMARPDPVVHARGLCRLSKGDLEVASHSRPPFMVVGVDGETWCWWSLEQVREALEEGETNLAALPGQRSWE